MSCPWIEIRAKKDEEKTLKYWPTIWELKQRYNCCRVEQYNLITDVLGGYSKHLEKSVRKLLGARARGGLEWMQKSVISNSLNLIAGTLAKSTRIIYHNQLPMTKSVQSLQQDIVINCVECCAKIQQDHQGHMLRVHFQEDVVHNFE